MVAPAEAAAMARVSLIDLSTLRVTVIAEVAGVFDDFTPLCSGFVVTNFFSGNLTLINPGGEILITTENEFEVTSSAIISPSPSVPPTSLFITDRGPLSGGGGGVFAYALNPEQTAFLCSQ